MAANVEVAKALLASVIDAIEKIERANMAIRTIVDMVSEISSSRTRTPVTRDTRGRYSNWGASDKERAYYHRYWKEYDQEMWNE